MNRFILKPLLLIALFLSSTLQPALAAEHNDEVGTMWNFTISKQVKRFNFQLQQNLWTMGDRYERYMPIAIVSYNVVPKYVKLNALYYYMNHQSSAGNYSDKHRYQVGATFSYPIKQFGLSLNSRFESTYTMGVEKPSNKWRNKFLFSYAIPNSNWMPFVHVDIFLFVNGKRSGEFDRLWYDAGVEYKINAKNAIEFKIREEQLLTKNPQLLNTVFSLGYKLKL